MSSKNQFLLFGIKQMFGKPAEVNNRLANI